MQYNMQGFPPKLEITVRHRAFSDQNRNLSEQFCHINLITRQMLQHRGGEPENACR